MNLFKRLKKIRIMGFRINTTTFCSDRVLHWVFPSLNHYSVVTWRRVNPRYRMSGGDFDTINEFAIADVSFCRTRLGANLVQLILGREQWTDGFREQVVEIIEPGIIDPGGLTYVPPTVSFNNYPTPPDPDLMPAQTDNYANARLNSLDKLEQTSQVSDNVRKTIKGL